MSRIKIPTKGVVIICRPDCGPCDTLKNYFNSKNIKFTEINAIEKKLPIFSVPQLYFNGKYITSGTTENFAALDKFFKDNDILKQTIQY